MRQREASVHSKIERRFRTSVNASLGSAKNKIGRRAAVCTKETITGDEESDVMSHPLVTSNSQEQMFPVKRAIHSIRKIGSARGLQSAGAAVLAGTFVVGVGIVGAMFDLGSWTESGRVAVK